MKMLKRGPVEYNNEQDQMFNEESMDQRLNTLKKVTPNLLKRQEAADYLGVSISTLDNWARVGILPRVKMGNRSVRYKKESLEQFINENNKKRVTL